MSPQMQEGLLRDIFRGLRIAQMAAQEALQVRGVLTVETPKGFCIPLPQPVPQFLFVFHRGYASYLLFVWAAQKVHCAGGGLFTMNRLHSDPEPLDE
jgi:hypothetical protein